MNDSFSRRALGGVLPGVACALLALWLGVGCTPSGLLARAIRVAPNRVPDFFKPSGPVVLRWPGGMMERFASGTNQVGSPAVAMHWRIVEPADYGLEITSTHGVVGGRTNREFGFRFRMPESTRFRSRQALGTAFLLHGYGEDGGAMFPWAMYLAQAGWRSVLVDLRGHGASGGRWVTFGVEEPNDLKCLRESLESAGRVEGPYVAVGHSMGASLALRWQVVDPEVRASVALGAYAEFEKALVRLRDGYARWMPRPWVRGAARRLPQLLGVGREVLDTSSAIRGRSMRAFLVSGQGDVVTPPEDGSELRGLAGPGSGFLIVGDATHEVLPYLFDQHGEVVLRWLAEVARESRSETVAAGEGGRGQDTH